MKFRKLMLASAISSALLLAGCGGAGSESESDSGSGSNSGSTTGATFSLTGVVVKGVVKNGVVTAYELVNGAWVARGSATTNEKGEYNLAIPATSYKGGIVKLTMTSVANSTQMKCELSACGSASFGEFYSDSVTLETMVPVSISGTGVALSNIPVTPYSNLVAKRVEALVQTNSSASQADVTTVASAVRSVVGFDPLTTKAVDITDTTAFKAASTYEQTAAIMSAAIADLAKTNNTSVSATVDALAATYSDGVFDESTDTLKLSQLITAWSDVQDDASVASAISTAGASAAVSLISTTSAEDTAKLSTGTYTPEASATLASFLNGVSEFYVAGIDDDLWVEGWQSSGSGSYSRIANSNLNVTSVTTYTSQNNSNNYHLMVDGSWIQDDESTLTVKTVNADGSVNITAPDSTNTTLSGNCYDLSGKSVLTEMQQLGSTYVIDSSAKFSSGAYGCLAFDNSASTDYYIYDTSGLNVNGSTLASTDDLLISGTPSASNLIKPIYVGNNQILTLLGDSSANSGIAQLWHRDSSSSSYVKDYESASGWSYQIINNAPILTLSVDIRAKVQNNADDGLFGFAVFMGKVQKVNLYSNSTQNESNYLMNKTAYDDILSGHSLDSDGDGYADTVDAAPTDPAVH